MVVLPSSSGALLSNRIVATVRESCSYHVAPFHPVWTAVVTRRLPHHHHHHHHQDHNSPLLRRRHQSTADADVSSSSSLREERWRKCAARLYARYVLDVAAASAALTLHRTARAEQAAAVASKPTDWVDWERKDWTDEWMRSLGASKLERFFTASKRLLTLAALSAPLAVMIPLSQLFAGRVQDWTWRYALWGIERAGPTFIKLTQWATTRQDLFSPEFCRYFGTLRDETAGHAWHETEKVLREELGSVIGDGGEGDGDGASPLLLQLERDPIGSGCIAQVYRGTLQEAVGLYPAGTEIACKVQHPGIWHKVCVDFYLMAKTATWLESLPYLNLKYLSLVDTVQQFRDIMLPQLDLTLEAKHLKRFNRDFASDDRVSFPVPLDSLTGTRCLTETFVRGTPILEYTKAEKKVRKELANLGLNTTLKMIFLHDFLHGDLHPGNILVSGGHPTSPHTKGHDLKLHLLDCGLVVEMGPEQHVLLVKILGAFTRRNGRLAGQLMVDTGTDHQASPVDVELFIKGIERIVHEDEDNRFIEKVGDYITDICYMACQRKVKLEPSFINAALAVEIMEGIATQLDPELIVTTAAMPLVVKAELMHSLPKFSLW